MARSIGDWFADHAHELPDGSPDDEVVERQAPWDLQSSGLSTTRSARRDGGLSAETAWTARSLAGGGRSAAAGTPAQYGAAASARSASSSVPKSVRKKILTAARINPRADVNSLAASLTRAGTPVSSSQVAAVLGRPLAAAGTRGRATDTSRVARKVASEIRRTAHANPQMGHKRLAALLRARGVDVDKAQVAEVLTRRWRLSSRNGRAAKGTKPAMVIKVNAGAQTSRTLHETPLCPSCGMRLSVLAMCRCS
ncbi:hypothetical protein [Geodermatophilus telluris]|uniref:hypothetical protein n=1 Tax=Geodermatophilus telluris TaxID=1190417 RepID=UPI000B861785|nr:hypothetical protein [Geodermatophilus telluris]